MWKSNWSKALGGGCLSRKASKPGSSSELFSLSMHIAPSTEQSKPWSRLCPSHHPPWCIRLPAVDKFSCSSRDDAFLSDCYQSGILSCRVLQTFGSWRKCMVSQDHFRSRPVHQLGHRLRSIGPHSRALMHMAGWLLPEQSLLLENLSTFLLFPFFPMCFLGACGLHWCYAWGEGS